jgi:hypothetical protein
MLLERHAKIGDSVRVENKPRELVPSERLLALLEKLDTASVRLDHIIEGRPFYRKA